MIELYLNDEEIYEISLNSEVIYVKTRAEAVRKVNLLSKKYNLEIIERW